MFSNPSLIFNNCILVDIRRCISNTCFRNASDFSDCIKCFIAEKIPSIYLKVYFKERCIIINNVNISCFYLTRLPCLKRENEIRNKGSWDRVMHHIVSKFTFISTPKLETRPAICSHKDFLVFST